LSFIATGGPPTICEIFFFCTGCESIPSLGFDGSGFITLDELVLPRIITFTRSITLPYSYVNSSSFEEKMEFAILATKLTNYYGKL
jgi:hypothetical protein